MADLLQRPYAWHICLCVLQFSQEFLFPQTIQVVIYRIVAECTNFWPLREFYYLSGSRESGLKPGEVIAKGSLSARFQGQG